MFFNFKMFNYNQFYLTKLVGRTVSMVFTIISNTFRGGTVENHPVGPLHHHHFHLGESAYKAVFPPESVSFRECGLWTV